VGAIGWRLAWLAPGKRRWRRWLSRSGGVGCSSKSAINDEADIERGENFERGERPRLGRRNSSVCLIECA